MDIITIKDLTFKYQDKVVIERLNLSIEEGIWLNIVGPNGSGKSTLVKLLTGLIKTYCYINVDKKILCRENIKQIRKIMGIVFENPDNQFVAETVMDDIAFSLENMKMNKKEIRKRVKWISQYLDIKHLLELEPHNLSGGEKQLVALASALVIHPKILILDEALTMIDQKEKDKIMDILVKLHHETKMTIINITHDLEECLSGDELLVLNEGKILLKGPTKEVLSESNVFDDIGIQLPFMADLSLKLKYYGLVDDLILDMDEMVDLLWK